MGNPWENHRKTMEKTIGKPENHGEIMRFWEKMMGISSINGNNVGKTMP